MWERVNYKKFKLREFSKEAEDRINKYYSVTSWETGEESIQKWSFILNVSEPIDDEVAIFIKENEK